MRTKSILAAAAIIAAGAASSMAQSNVYSLNVVGYVNKPFVSGNAYIVTSPLTSGSNTLKDIIPNPPDNTVVLRWDVGAQDLSGTVPTYSTALSQWSPNPVIATGEAFLVVGAGDFTNTFVGEVRQGAITVPIAGNGNADLIGSPVPVAGNLSVILTNYPAVDNDIVLYWDVGAQDLSGTVSTYSAALSSWSAGPGPVNVADGFLLVRGGAPVNWVRNFTVQ